MYEERDDSFVLSLECSTDHEYLFLVAHSSSANEIRFTPAHCPNQFTLLQPRADHVMYFVDHRRGYFYIGSNRDAENFQIWRVAVADATDFRKWELVLPHNEDIYLLNIDTFDSQVLPNLVV
jgi:oligopeptidase B